MPAHSSIDYQSLFCLAPSPGLIIDLDFVIVDVNRKYLEEARRDRADLVGRSIFDAFPLPPGEIEPPDGHVFRRSLQRVLDTHQSDTLLMQRYPIPLSTPDGTVFEERFWSVVNTPLFDGAGRMTGILHTPVDVTALDAAHDQLHAASLAHDVRTRIEGSVLLHAQALQDSNRVLDAERRRLLDLFEQAPGFVYLTRGPDHVFELANRKLNQLTGHRELAGRPIRDAFPDLTGQGVFELLDKVFRTGKPYVGQGMRLMLQNTPDGTPTETFLDFMYQPIKDDSGAVTGIFAQGHDITRLKRVEAELRLNNERWNFVLQGSGDAYWDWDLRSNRLLLSRRWHEMLGLEENEVEDQIRESRRRMHPDDRRRVYGQINACRDNHSETFSCEYRLQAKDGSWRWVHARGKVVSRDLDGKALRMTGTVTDISEKKRSEEQIWRQANFDSLTGLPNRALFRDRLASEVRKAERTGARFALLFIDLDHFKEANDLLGHDIGDVLLTRAAERIGAGVRTSDTVARLGGDEFTVILSDIENEVSTEQVASKILDALSKPFCLGNEVLYLSASVGITIYPNDATEPEDLVRNADQAMYVAKHTGRNRYSFFTPSLQERAHSRLRLIAEMREALAANQFKVFFQPIIDLTHGRIMKAEALLRWVHPTHGMFYPSEFIGIAEETGLIHEIGNWVFMESAWWSQRWSHQLGAPFQISVNTSPVQFHASPDGIDWVKYLTDLGVSRNCISVEITEGLLLNASASVSDRLLEYRDAGIQVALDDFGTGYSSMSYLKKFDIDYLKIDQSFVRDMSHNQGSRTIAETMIVMAHKLGLKVIAEGIETPEQRDLLAGAGCDYGQGFLFSQAVSPQELEALLQRPPQPAAGATRSFPMH